MNRRPSPVASVLVTTYNHEPYIAEALHGVLGQVTSHELEIVVGVDRSTDRTAEIVREIAAASSGVVRPLVHDERLGLMENLRRVYAAARGRYLAILDGDDFWTHPHKLQTQIDLLESDPGIAAVGHFVEQRTTVGELRDPIPQWPYEPVSAGRVFLERLCDLHTSSLLFRQIFPQGLPAALLDPRARVPDLGLKVALAGHGRVAFVAETWSVFRRVPGSVSWDLSYEAPEWRAAVARGLGNVRHLVPADLAPVLGRLIADQLLAAASRRPSFLAGAADRVGALRAAPAHALSEMAKTAYARFPEPAKRAFRAVRGGVSRGRVDG